MMLVQAQAYRQQYGFNAIVLFPVNLYGPGDNFDMQTSHVIPALIRKCVEAQAKGEKQVVLWGDGSPSREFLYVDDAARAILLAAEHYNGDEPVNIGTGEEITIQDLAHLIADEVGYKRGTRVGHRQAKWATRGGASIQGGRKSCLDLICYASMMAIGLVTAMYSNLRSMHWWIFVIYGLATAGTGLWALSESELARPSDSRQVWDSVRESWGHGRWTLGGVLVTWVQKPELRIFFSGLLRI
jgi:hypothetical protein